MSDDLPILRGDLHDEALRAHVHPDDHVNPTPKDSYQLVVVGGGPAGLVAAFGAAGLGARVAIVERGLLGGDCLNVGCVPSKALLAAAHAAAEARQAGAFGVRIEGPITVDFGAVMARMRALRAGISHHDSVQRLQDAGIDVFLGSGRFTGPQTLAVGDATLTFRRALIATGAHAARPPIPGIDEVEPLDNASLFQLTDRPQRLIVLGAGPIGAEMAQAFARFGSEVSLVDMADRVLPREDPDASAVVAEALVRDGVDLVLGAKVLRFERRDGARVVVVDRGQGEEALAGDGILLALGRRPNLEGLDPDAAGVAHTKAGITVDDHLHTSNPRIYAAGDVASRFQFTHAADAMARIVIQNAFFWDMKRASALVIPWATYTSPEVAHVGPTVEELAGRTDLQTFTVPLADLDRAVTDGTLEGFARAHVDGRGRIVAATVVGPHAGDLINEVSLAMTHGIGIAGLDATIHAYPNRSEVLKRLGGAYNRTRLTPARARMLKTWLDWRLG